MAKGKSKFLNKLRKFKPKPFWPALLLLLLVLSFFTFYFGRIYPGVSVAGINLSGKTPEEAIKIVSGLTPPETITLVATSSQNQTFNISVKTIEANYNYNDTAAAAFKVGRSGNVLFDVWQISNSLFENKDVGLRVTLNEDKLYESFQAISEQVAENPVVPSAKILNGKVTLEKGKAGTELDLNLLRVLVGSNLSQAKSTPINVPVEKVDPSLNPFEEAAFQKRAESLADKTLDLKFEHQVVEFSKNNLLVFLNGKGGFNEDEIKKASERAASEINRPVQEPKLVFEGTRVKEFKPSKGGVTVNKEELTTLIEMALTNAESEESKIIEVSIPVSSVSPKVKTANANNLGISELVGRGTSTFYGSIPSRVHNVALAASRVSGTLVPPGETFSFNNAVGDISEATGFQKAYIIQAGKTILGDGGGVCQVSTTLFRAVLNAGLPITERAAHAYRVGYYEQGSPPGIDATVFSPSVDFKFKNDTANYILIQATTDTKKLSLVFELYGTKDGRVSEVGKPVITSTTPAPPDVYVDDPTLKAGVIKQTEHRALGTKLYFTYKVVRDGIITFQKTFYSNYKPWANVYLRGTGI